MSDIPKNVPRAIVDLDRPRTITFQLDALQRLQQVLEKPLTQIKLDPAEMMLEVDRWVWAGLIDADRDVSIGQVRAMIHLGNLPTVLTAVTDVANSSFPKGAEGNVGKGGRKETQSKRSTSTDSGRSASTTSG